MFYNTNVVPFHICRSNSMPFFICMYAFLDLHQLRGCVMT